MKKYRVSVNVVRCCDIFVDAFAPAEAQQMVLKGRLWLDEGRRSMVRTATSAPETIDQCVEVDDDCNEV